MAVLAPPLQDAGADLEAGFGRLGGHRADLDPLDPGERWRLLIEGLQEARAIAALDLQQDAIAIVEHPACQAEASGEIMDEGAISYALDQSPDTHAGAGER